MGIRFSLLQVVAGILAVVIVSIILFWFFRYFQIRTAKEYVSVAIHFMNPEISISRETYQRYGIPRALRSNSEVATYFLLKSADIGYLEYSGAYYYLGLLFLDQDCGVARYYLERHNALVNSDEVSADIELIEKEGCGALLRKFTSAKESEAPGRGKAQ